MQLEQPRGNVSLFKDARIGKRMDELVEKMVEMESVVIHQLGENEAQQRSFYRLIHNERVETEEIKGYLYADAERQIVAGKHYLVIQHTTQPNFERNRSNIKQQAGLGVIGNKKDLGFFLHPSLVVEAQGGACLGYSNVITWSRSVDAAGKEARHYKAQPIASKESYRWLEASQQSKQVLAATGQLTRIADREGDITELFQQVPDERTHLLIRSCQDRLLADSKLKLYHYLAQQQPGGSFQLAIKNDKRSKAVKRNATIVLRWGKVRLAPLALKGATLEMYALQAREEHPPEGQKPILWRLLTTHPIESIQEAKQVCQWYSERWNIEQVFPLLKHQGLQVEMLDLESGKSLIQITLLALLTVSKILLLHLAAKQEEPLPLQESFTLEEVECMKALHQKYEGKTLKQKNPYPANSLQWCYWIMARLGAWKPGKKKAGVICLMRGVRRFNHICHGWLMAKQLVS